jgi:hypothetical protein
MITKAERTELRSIVRNQFRVLRAEITQRQRELAADIDEQIAQRYATDDKAWADAAHLAQEAVLEANRRVNDAYRDLIGDRHVERHYVAWQMPQKPARERIVLRSEALSRLMATVSAAELRLARQEADLLRNLAVGALETEEARAFLSAIPTVSELVPAARLAELEADLQEPTP